MNEAVLRRSRAHDAGVGAAWYACTTSVVVLGDPTRKYLARWMLDGDTDSVVSFAAGMWDFFRSVRPATPLEIAEFMTGMCVQGDSSVAYFPSHFPTIHGVPESAMEKMARGMFDLVANTNLGYA